jgi:vacuolar-type H+-ATPase subunit I/STV1
VTFRKFTKGAITGGFQVKNYIETEADKTTIIPSIAECEKTLENLKSQLEAAVAQERELRDSEEELSIRAFDGDAKAKHSLDRLDEDIKEIVTRQRMLKAGLKRGESNLIEAKRVEAERIAKDKATNARQIVAEFPPLGVKMASAIEAFLAVYKEYQAAEKRLVPTGYPAFAHLEAVVSGRLATILQQAGFTSLDLYQGHHPGQTFETIFRDLERGIRAKTAVVIGDAVEPAKVIKAPAVERLPEEPILTVERIYIASP